MITIPIWLFVIMCVGLVSLASGLLYFIYVMLHMFDGIF
jgi:hypothetical protein